MNYWILSPNVDNGKNETAWKKAILSLHHAFMGYGTDHNLGSMFSKSVAIGDMILIAQGKNSNKRLFLCGIVETKATWEHKKNTPGDAQNRKLINVLTKPELDNLNLDLNGCAYGESSQPAAIYQLKPNENLNDLRVINTLLHEMKMKENISILEHKKQIILQGPPGTGKTRLAKQIAEVLTKEVKTLNPLDKVNAFFQKNKYSQNSIAKTEANKKLTHFNLTYPKENLKEISIEEYAIGTGENNTFCWWMEIGLKSLGYYFPGNSNTYRIYWSKKQDSYIISGNLLKDKEEDEAFLTLKEHLFKLVNEKDYLIGKDVFTESFMLKILHSYYPEEYFPVNSDHCMNNILKLLNIPNNKLDRLEKNKKIQDFFNSKKDAFKTNVSSYDFMGFLFEEFDLKGIINFEGSAVIEKGAFKIIQFHPSYTYEDFVRGISVKSNASETIEYRTENRVLAEFAEMALNNKSSNYVLIIDEINRANLPSVLGELIYALEYRGESVDSMYDIDGVRKITLPPNLFIIGTMNTADRSVGQIDYAIRRRFAFIDVLPEVLNEIDLNANRKEEEPQLYFKENIFKKVEALFKTITEDKNEENSEYLSEEFKPKDVQLGHSYFIYTEGNFDYNIKYEIKPILKEYVRDGILKTSALTIIDAL